MSFRRNRAPLYSGVVVAILVVLLAAVLALLHFQREMERKQQNLSQNLARSLEVNIQAAIDIVDLSLLASVYEITRQIVGGHPDQPSITRFLMRQQGRIPHLGLLRATDQVGDVVYGAAIPSPRPSSAEHDYFIRLRDDPESDLLIAAPMIEPISQRWIWLMARRISKPDGSFGGVVYGALFVDQLAGMLAQVRTDNGDSISLRDAATGLVARLAPVNVTSPLPGDKRLAAQFSRALAASPAQGRYVGGEAGTDDLTQTHAYRRNAKYGFIVNAGVSQASALAEWDRQVSVVLGLVTAFVLATVAFTWLILRSWRREERDVEALDASRRSLQEAQAIANLGHFSFDLRAQRWNSSDILDRILGIDSSYPRDTPGWLNLIAGEFRSEMQAYLASLPDQQAPFDRELRIVRPDDGRSRWVQCRGQAAIDTRSGALALHGTVQDITERVALEEQVRQLAYQDGLTQLPNRNLLNDRLAQAMAVSKRSGCHVALMFLDLDNFKALNDTQGHGVGDLLLTEVARRLAACVREMDTVARFGGDEFVVILGELGLDRQESLAQARTVAEKIRLSLSEPYQLNIGQHEGSAAGWAEHRCTVSIGVVVFAAQQTSADELMKWADTAMYQAKEAGGNMARFHTSAA
ncbi:MAG: diguanylate cyclase domain-containing protein [Rhodoferax sp.]